MISKYRMKYDFHNNLNDFRFQSKHWFQFFRDKKQKYLNNSIREQNLMSFE
jgi:hypothetical protein